MILLAVMALATLAANGARQLRHVAIGFLIVSLSTTALSAGISSVAQLAVIACAGLVSAAVLYVSARDAEYGEEVGWRLWAATIVAAAVTPAAFALFRTATAEATALPLFGIETSGISVQVAAFWLLSSGVAILLTARSAVRTALGALLVLTGVQLLVRLVADSPLALTLIFAWLQVVAALVGAFLIVNERAVREA